ncbi:sensor histidine kinase [Nocardioides aurantiacus]|uniref:sensor histidine kinase n=1 Tax=Nocardioides aurantiacus TaxID=86796 RepID=UPI00403F89BF
MTDIGRVALAARVFTLAALLPLTVLAGTGDLLGIGVVAAAALLALLADARGPWSPTTVALLEGTVVAVTAAVGFPAHTTVTPYLVVPVLVAALDSGRAGLVRVLVLELAAMVLVRLVVVQRWDVDFATEAVLWLATGVGLGFLGATLRNAQAATDTDTSYRSAVGLIRRLEALAGRLSGGLDAVGIAEQVMEEADDTVPLRAAGVFTRSTTGAMVPLRYSAGTEPGAMAWAEELSARCWEYEAMMLRERRLALPLVSNDETIAVLVLEALRPVESASALELRTRLSRLAVQLQAALLFGRVRDSATAQERQRIAREVHDGVAQDVAGLGYLVDNLAAGTRDPDQLARIVVLREEVTRVVAELRHSIFDLRHELAASSGLGESLSAYANQVGTTSTMTVHVTLDEEGPRLPRDQEFELMRIAQEAMNNARKHSGAANLWLRCTVRSPYAEVEVRDDGTRGHRSRADSQGLKIMRERSMAIGADLGIEAPTPERPGTRVQVRVGAPAR